MSIVPEPLRPVAALAISDLHLSHKPPVARSVEEDWYEVQAGYLKQLRELAISCLNPPIVCAGDVFDDGWREGRCPPELINFALEHLPRVYAVPGQHDLKHHSLRDLKKSAYWTLMMAGVVTNLEYKKPLCVQDIMLHGFPWGEELFPMEKKDKYDLLLDVAVIHKYVWKKGHGYPGAPKESKLICLRDRLLGYDAIVAGDNHDGFLSHNFLNCGSFLRRKIDEIFYQPCVGVIYQDGSIERVPLDTTQDKFLSPEDVLQVAETAPDMTHLMGELLSTSDIDISFEEVLRRELADNKDKYTDGVRKVILDCLGGEK